MKPSLTRWIVLLAITLLSFLSLTTVATAKAQPPSSSTASPPTQIVLGALCDHAGRHFTTRWYPGAQIQYVLWGVHYYFATKYDDLPHGPAGNDGEGPWPGTVGSLYGGGLSFMVGTWNRNGGLQARSVYDIAKASVEEQISRLWAVVQQDHGSFQEWPTTSRACGLPVVATR